MSYIHRQFFALNTAVEGGLVADDHAGNDLFDQLEKRVNAFEKRFSRFNEDSELTAINSQAGQQVSISQEMVDLLMTAQKVWERTNGLIDPMIGQALVAAGYHDSFERLNGQKLDKSLVTKLTEVVFSDIQLDTEQSTVITPQGSCLDFGGIGKGYLADALVSDIELVTKNYWFSLGGDLIVSGKDEQGNAWPVAVQDPQSHDRDIGRIASPAGRWGIATSGTTKRRGQTGPNAWHHIIDPQTRRPAVTDVLGATVLAASALMADAFAKVVLLLGADQGLAWASQQVNCEALAITADRVVHQTSGMEKYFTAE